MKAAQGFVRLTLRFLGLGRHLPSGERQRDRETERQRDREAERQRGREAERQRGREAERQRE